MSRLSAIKVEPDTLMRLVREHLVACGLPSDIHAIQIVVEQPFGDGMKVHNEVPSLVVLVADNNQ